jgi:muramoyltetrapeptide carboxypeptidase
MTKDPIRPARVRPGDFVRIIAPSGPVPVDAFAKGAAVLSSRYELRYDSAELFRSEGYLAGSDEQRLASLIAALEDKYTHAIFLGRGGYGLLRILAAVEPRLFRKHPKPIIGFSDGTALLAAAARAGVTSVHGPVVTQLGRLPPKDRTALFALLENPEPSALLRDLKVLRPGTATGPLLGGNLEVFSRLLGTQLLPSLRGAILFFEEVGERPYRIDRLLTHLELAGVWEHVAAVIVGDLVACEEPASARVSSPAAIDVVRERLGRLRVPVVLAAPIGHGDRNIALPYGVRVHLDTREGTLVSLEGAVC